MRTRPFTSTPISAAPTTVPPTLPTPPKSEVPPITTAEITRELVADAGDGFRRVEARGEGEGGEAREEAVDHVDRGGDALDSQAREAGGLGVAADRADRAAMAQGQVAEGRAGGLAVADRDRRLEAPDRDAVQTTA